MITNEMIGKSVKSLTDAMRAVLTAQHIEAKGKINASTRKGLESRGLLMDGELTELGRSVCASLKGVSMVSVNGHAISDTPNETGNERLTGVRRSVSSRRAKRADRRSTKPATTFKRCERCAMPHGVLANGTVKRHTRFATGAEFVSRGNVRVHCHGSGKLASA